MLGSYSLRNSPAVSPLDLIDPDSTSISPLLGAFFLLPIPSRRLGSLVPSLCCALARPCPLDLSPSLSDWPLAASFCSQGHALLHPRSFSQCCLFCIVLSKNHESRVQVSLPLKPVFLSGPPSKFLLPIWEICRSGIWECQGQLGFHSALSPGPLD